MQIIKSVTTAIRSRMDNHAQKSEKSRSINRWVVYKQLCIAKGSFGLNDRCLAVLSSLLSFYPDDMITPTKGLVIFPSNKQLSLRAHGMPESTLRRHLATLIAAGIITRKDSPTRKRYAHKDNKGEIEIAFGFSIEPLLNRANEISQAAAQITTDIKAIKRLRDEVSVVRREIAAIYATLNNQTLSKDKQSLYVRFRDIVNNIPRRATRTELEALLAQFNIIFQELVNPLDDKEDIKDMSATDAQIERRHNESLTESLYINNKIQNDDLLMSEHINPLVAQMKKPKNKSLSLINVLNACPEIVSYAPSGIRSWRDLLETSHLVSKFMGISQQLWLKSIHAIGFENTSSVIAWLLQKGTDIKSPIGYFSSLIEKARQGKLSVACMIMACLITNGSKRFF